MGMCEEGGGAERVTYGLAESVCMGARGRVRGRRGDLRHSQPGQLSWACPETQHSQYIVHVFRVRREGEARKTFSL